MQLESGDQWKTLTTALNQFNLGNFDLMLKFELNKDREDIALGNNKTQIVYRVIEEYNFRDQVELLVLAARRFNPTNGQLQIAAQQLGIATQIDAVTYDDQGASTITAVDPLQLQRQIRAINPNLNAKEWAIKLLNMESRICRVENSENPSQGIGTAFLVAPDRVMTNYHVIEPFIDADSGDLQAERLRLRFDYSFAPDGVALPPGVVYEVSKLLSSSPMSEYDEMPSPPNDPASDQLDYALLEVEGSPGADPVGGELKPELLGAATTTGRGWIPMPLDAYDFDKDAPLLIYQHPEGGPLKLAIETNAIEQINGNKTRVRYRTNTEPGSSGSPCFDMDWNLVALHHAGGWYNQGIPFAAILTHDKRSEKLLSS